VDTTEEIIVPPAVAASPAMTDEEKAAEEAKADLPEKVKHILYYTSTNRHT
jgi:hypothetical protein